MVLKNNEYPAAAPPNNQGGRRRRRRHPYVAGFLAGLCAAVLFISLAWYFLTGSLPFGSGLLTVTNLAKAGVIEKMVEKYYLDEVDVEEATDGMYSGLVSSLGDKYSGYYTEEEYQTLMESSTGSYHGIGVVLTQDESGALVVVTCYAGTPAEKAGICENDIITAVDGESTEGMTTTELAAAIRSRTDEEVSLTLERDGETIEVSVLPETVEIPVVSGRMLDEETGYIAINEFTDGTPDQFQEAYQEILDQGAKGLIIDLRENPGGLLTSVCDTLEQILPEGLIVYMEDKYGNRVEYTCEGDTPIEIPLVVLVNENSASAAEIFAGAVKDHGVATLVGTTTFGKGIVQRIFPLADGSAIKLTISKYYTPSGVNIHGTGIEPDVEVEWVGEEDFPGTSAYEEMETDDWLAADNQMKAAYDCLMDQLNN